LAPVQLDRLAVTALMAAASTASAFDDLEIQSSGIPDNPYLAPAHEPMKNDLGANVKITIFGEKMGVFLKNQCYDQNFAQFSFVLSQKRQFFRIFLAKIF
jgi:hypothetical protein